MYKINWPLWWGKFYRTKLSNHYTYRDRINQGCRNRVAGEAHFNRSLNHISTRGGGADYAPHYSLHPPNPGFSDLPTVLIKARQRQHYSARTFSEWVARNDADNGVMHCCRIRGDRGGQGRPVYIYWESVLFPGTIKMRLLFPIFR